jgi:hypothetical protein
MALLGSGDCSQFGLSDGSPVALPISITALTTTLCSVAVRWGHIVFVDSSGIPHVLGNDKTAMLGTDSRSIYSSPTAIHIDTDPISCVAGTQFDTAYLTATGRIIICSEKSEGAPIVVNLENPGVFVNGSYAELVAIDNTGALYQFLFDSQERPIRHALHKSVYDAARGDGFIITVATDGSTFGNGLLNDGSDEFSRIASLKGEKVLRVFAYYSHAAVITSDYRVLTWGQNNKGQLGRGKRYATTEFGEVAGLEGQSIIEVALGYEFSLFRTTRGLLFGCGSNRYGQLFMPPSKKVTVPIRCTLAPENVTAVYAGDKFSIVSAGGKVATHPGMYSFSIEMGPREGPRSKSFYRDAPRRMNRGPPYPK